MPYVPVPEDLPGIRGLLAFKPASGVAVAGMIHQLLRGESPLSAADRERIAAHVSRLNECELCARAHAASATGPVCTLSGTGVWDWICRGACGAMSSRDAFFSRQRLPLWVIC